MKRLSRLFLRGDARSSVQVGSITLEISGTGKPRCCGGGKRSGWETCIIPASSATVPTTCCIPIQNTNRFGSRANSPGKVLMATSRPSLPCAPDTPRPCRQRLIDTRCNTVRIVGQGGSQQLSACLSWLPLREFGIVFDAGRHERTAATAVGARFLRRRV
jgi:hypothetical protein